MEKMESCVLDYSDLCPAVEDPNLEFLESGREPLTKDMFDPYFPFDPHHHIAIGDVLDISILGEDIVATDQFVVAPDGRVYYSLVREGVEAAGRTTQEIGTDLAEHLKHLYHDPIVTVIPRVSKGLSFKILGRVRTPGVYPLTGGITIKEAIGFAGGFYSKANTDYYQENRSLDEPLEDLTLSYIVRNNKRLDIDFNSLMTTATNAQNIYLRPGDFIYISPPEKNDIFVLGAVPAPQKVSYIKGIRLMEVLSRAGVLVYPGPYTANLHQILVLRGALNCPCVMQVDITQILKGEARDVYLQPGDIVYAQDKPYRLGRELVYIAINAFVQSFSITAANYYSQRHWFPPRAATIETVTGANP
jgi:protein involved in polysaccharide export with SLBB domain